MSYVVVDFTESTSAITPAVLYPRSLILTIHLQHQPFPFHTLQPVYVYGTIKLAPWGAESPSQ